jgi:heptosyltransferase-2
MVIFLPNWLGDLVMATPTLRALYQQYGGQTEIIGIVRPHLAPILDAAPWLHSFWYFDPRGSDPRRRRLGLVRQMRRQPIDLAVLLPNSFQAALLAWCGGARERLGFVRDGRGLLLTQRVRPPHPDTPVVEYYLQLAAAAGCPAESPRLELRTTEADEQSADMVFARLHLPRDGSVVAFNTGSANGEARSWPVDRLASLARRIVTGERRQVLVFCGPREQAVARQIVSLADCSGVHSMAEEPLDLGTAKACLRRCGALVTSDSGPRHVAAALGLPVITLYGPTPSRWSANPTVDAVDVQADLDCLGCGAKVCPRGHHRCMNDLSVETVLAAVSGVLRRKAAA